MDNLLVFKAISAFVTELSELLNKKNKPLALYRRLIERTTIVHEKPIEKHIQVFRKFCVTNRDAILERSLEQLTEPRISYSDTIFVDVPRIMSLIDRESQAAVWQHLLTIAAFVDPGTRAKEVLRSTMKEPKSEVSDAESNFLSGLINKIEDTVDPDADPMAAVSSVMSSGIFTDLIGSMTQGMANGELDMGSLMGAMQGMMGGLQNANGGDGQENPMAGMMGMVNSMMSNLMEGPMATPGQGLENMGRPSRPPPQVFEDAEEDEVAVPVGPGPVQPDKIAESVVEPVESVAAVEPTEPTEPATVEEE